MRYTHHATGDRIGLPRLRRDVLWHRCTDAGPVKRGFVLRCASIGILTKGLQRAANWSTIGISTDRTAMRLAACTLIWLVVPPWWSCILIGICCAWYRPLQLTDERAVHSNPVK